MRGVLQHQQRFDFAFVIPVAHGDDGHPQRPVGEVYEQVPLRGVVRVNITNFFNQLRRGQDLFDGLAPQVLGANAEHLPERTIGRNDGAIEGENHQRHRKRRHHLLVITALRLDKCK